MEEDTVPLRVDASSCVVCKRSKSNCINLIRSSLFPIKKRIIDQCDYLSMIHKHIGPLRMPNKPKICCSCLKFFDKLKYLIDLCAQVDSLQLDDTKDTFVLPEDPGKILENMGLVHARANSALDSANLETRKGNQTRKDCGCKCTCYKAGSATQPVDLSDPDTSNTSSGQSDKIIFREDRCRPILSKPWPGIKPLVISPVVSGDNSAIQSGSSTGKIEIQENPFRLIIHAPVAEAVQPIEPIPVKENLTREAEHGDVIHDHSYAPVETKTSRDIAEATKRHVFFSDEKITETTRWACEMTLSNIIRHIQNKDFEYAANDIMKVPQFQRKIEQKILHGVSTVCDKLVATSQGSKPSVLCMSDIQELCSRDIISEAYIELKKELPFVFEILLAVSTGMYMGKRAPIEMISMIYAMLMRTRNARLGAIQRMLTATAIHLKAEPEVWYGQDKDIWD